MRQGPIKSCSAFVPTTLMLAATSCTTACRPATGATWLKREPIPKGGSKPAASAPTPALIRSASGHRPGIVALGPVPVQVNYLGYPGSMGAPYFDYIIADNLVIPEEHRDFYAEKIVTLPDTYQCDDSAQRVLPKTPTRAEVGLPPDGFIFCCFNNSRKITPDHFDLWMRLLAEVGQSVLWLFEDNLDGTRNLKREAQARGIPPSRLVFAPRVGHAEHLSRHRLADLF